MRMAGRIVGAHLLDRIELPRSKREWEWARGDMEHSSPLAFRIHAALDLKGGVVVRAGGGDRSRYPPLRWAMAGLTSEPLDIARALRRELGIGSLYVADLDAISGAPPRERALRALLDDGFGLLVDAGCRGGSDAERLAALGPLDVVAAVETLEGPRGLAEVIRAIGSHRAVFGLDLRRGALIEGAGDWPLRPTDAARAARELGVRRMLVIDLGLVGSRAGPPFGVVEELTSELRDVEVIAGGGMRSFEDVVRLRRLGAAGAVVATALWEGSLCRADVETLEGRAGGEKKAGKKAGGGAGAGEGGGKKTGTGTGTEADTR